jgi:hypothetical protein
MRGGFRNGVGTSRVEQGGLVLRRRGRAVVSEDPALVETNGLADAFDGAAKGVEHAQGAEPDDVAGELRLIEADPDVGLCAEVVDFVGLNGFDDAAEAAAVAQVAVVEEEAGLRS